MKSERNTIRCAIYTRKSTEEGLEQSFNSLHAQREACEAYVVSQKHEGWTVVPTHYDDGGYSGGNMERPSLARLLQDVKGEKISTIVVYKVDRLTRSLADFAKIIEQLDERGVSFVSVTQQFNTTTSMGRLTLNVLLSFAQFEREVTGERIRDKIAASKKKGMWMGGFVPLGYDLEQRSLVPNPRDAQSVVKIFRLYLELGCVSKLKQRLDEEGIRSKVRVTCTGKKLGGNRLSRGALYALLRNRLYLGEIRHRETWYSGQHQAIIIRDLWDKVQAELSSHDQGRRNGVKARTRSLLAGLLQDSEGNRFTPSHTTKNGKRYRYYVCQSVFRDPGLRAVGPWRLPAHDIETQVIVRLHAFLQSEKDVFDQLAMPDDSPAVAQKRLRAARELCVRWPSINLSELQGLVTKVIDRIVVRESSIELVLSRKLLREVLSGDWEVTATSEPGSRNPGDLIHLPVEARLRRCGMEVRLMVPPGSVPDTSQRPKPCLLKAVVRAHQWYRWALEGKVTNAASIARLVCLSERYVARVFQCAFLAPDIVEAILEGRQPVHLTFEKLCRNLPLNWVEQRQQLGFSR